MIAFCVYLNSLMNAILSYDHIIWDRLFFLCRLIYRLNDIIKLAITQTPFVALIFFLLCLETNTDSYVASSTFCCSSFTAASVAPFGWPPCSTVFFLDAITLDGTNKLLLSFNFKVEQSLEASE